MLRWIARFSFTLLIVGGWCLYEAYLGTSRPERRLQTWQVTLLTIGGALAISLGLRGIRERHRPRDD